MPTLAQGRIEFFSFLSLSDCTTIRPLYVWMHWVFSSFFFSFFDLMSWFRLFSYKGLKKLRRHVVEVVHIEGISAVEAEEERKSLNYAKMSHIMSSLTLFIPQKRSTCNLPWKLGMVVSLAFQGLTISKHSLKGNLHNLTHFLNILHICYKIFILQ